LIQRLTLGTVGIDGSCRVQVGDPNGIIRVGALVLAMQY
jgi:hypothetical protein